MTYNPFDWYWIKDGAVEVFSSARLIVVPDDDAGYLAHVATEGSAQRWPEDASGDQTQDALQEVLTPYGLDASLIGYAIRKRKEREYGGFVWESYDAPSDAYTQQLLQGARASADADANFTMTWVNPATGAAVLFTSVQIIEASYAMQAHITECFTIYSTVKDGIDAETITTMAEIDAAFAVMTTWRTPLQGNLIISSVEPTVA